MLSLPSESMLETLVHDTSILQRAYEESHEYRLFLKSPIIKREKKLKIVQELFRGKVSTEMLQFLMLVVEKGRENVLPEILSEFLKLYNERKGIVEVEVQTAIPLSKEQETKIVEHFRTYTKRSVKLRLTLNPSLIGGFIARVGDTMFDGSVRHQLELLRSQFRAEVQ